MNHKGRRKAPIAMTGALIGFFSHHASFGTLRGSAGCRWVDGLVPRHSLYGIVVFGLARLAICPILFLSREGLLSTVPSRGALAKACRLGEKDRDYG